MPTKRSLSLIALGLLLAACGSTEPKVVIVTATPAPVATVLVVATNPPPPPTSTSLPTSTPAPRFEPIPIGEVEAALRDAGYRRYPFTNADSISGYYWVKESIYEQTTTWETGAFELQVLHDRAPGVRVDHMERKFEAIAAAFPVEFMLELRNAFARYNELVRPDVSGEPDEVFSFGGDWKDVWAQYYVSEMTIQGYRVTLSVWWWQTTCPPQYLYCYFDQFPGLEFTGDSSFKFLTINMEPPSRPILGGST